VILTYLAETLGRYGHRNEDERWRIQEWLAWDNQRMSGGPALLRYLRRWFPETDPAVLAFITARAERALGQLDACLGESEWLAGDRPTIADIATCAYAFWLDEAGFDPARWPAIGAWLRRIGKLPGFAQPDALMPAPAA
jgi:glutathione S-transferase